MHVDTPVAGLAVAFRAASVFPMTPTVAEDRSSVARFDTRLGPLFGINASREQEPSGRAGLECTAAIPKIAIVSEDQMAFLNVELADHKAKSATTICQRTTTSALYQA